MDTPRACTRGREDVSSQATQGHGGTVTARFHVREAPTVGFPARDLPEKARLRARTKMGLSGGEGGVSRGHRGSEGREPLLYDAFAQRSQLTAL